MSTTDRRGMRGPERRAPDACRVHGKKGEKGVEGVEGVEIDQGRSGCIASGASVCVDFD
ncbi:hypothetical protein [Burkholderia cepacia]|uniref:Uncharacterized protein n=1 Tax=Burkholderia cepacia TaxID=292 RepID=A0A8I1APT4_BURCE|nr:hypothetical protein [Burkholderia cepacia]MBH9681426.1 hypothetical protein [Burkholderia cepacia]MBH9697112.1 hypothetical protein [Burkholderia cepacia]MBH9711733.1 hypothetical protein [Burkholderia cepacia]MBH9732398.1 hypothetical protein [Burkholderia cepacia]MBX3759742.1 hypothetical protein [Burkholderia cepacia]